MKLDSLEKLYAHELKDLWSASKQAQQALPSMIEAADDQELKQTLTAYSKAYDDRIERLETIFDGMDFEPRGHRCKGMSGLVDEAKDLLQAEATPEVRDAGIIASTQRIHHYEMAGYGVARTYAEKLGEQAAADLLQKTLDEAGDANRALTRLAERRINFEALVTA